MFTRQHHNAVGELLVDLIKDGKIDKDVANSFGSLFARDNVNFSWAKWEAKIEEANESSAYLEVGL